MQETGPETGWETSYTVALRGPSRRTTAHSAGPELSQEWDRRWALPTTQLRQGLKAPG